METRNPQQPSEQPDAQKPDTEPRDVGEKLAQLDQALSGVRESIEHIKQALARRAAPDQEAGREATAPGGERPREETNASQGEGAEEPREQAEESREGAEDEAEEQKSTVSLFDGSAESFRAWKTVGGDGSFEHIGEELQLRAGSERELAFYATERFDDFRLKSQYSIRPADASMRLAVRFRNPEQPVPDRENPEATASFDNPALVARQTGFEICLGSGSGAGPGSIDGIEVGDAPGKQHRDPSAQVALRDWNDLEVEMRGDELSVRLNGVETARLSNTDNYRGQPAAADPHAGFIGIVAGESRTGGEKPAAEAPQEQGQEAPQPTRQGARAVRPRLRSAPGPLPPSLSGPVMPGRSTARHAGAQRPGSAPPSAPAQAALLAVRRIEVEKLAGAPAQARREGEKPEGDQAKKKKLSPTAMEAIHAEAAATLARLKAKDAGIAGSLQKAYGYAVFPSVGRASLLLGGARGYGEVFEKGSSVGFARLTQITFGVQVGGQTFSELILFGSKESLDAFKREPTTFNANLSAAFIRGASGTVDFKDVSARAYSRGGMLLEASLGGQKFRFMPRPPPGEAANEPGGGGTGRLRRAAEGLGKFVAGKIGSHHSDEKN